MPKLTQTPFSAYAGTLLRHDQGRTLTQADNTWYTLLTLNTANHFDLARGAHGEFGQVLMNSTFTFAVAIGIMSREFGGDLLQRMTLHEIKLVKTMFAGDTLYMVSQIGEPDDECVQVVSTGYNQAQDAVVEIRWDYDLRPLSLLARLEAARAVAPTLDPDRRFTPQVHAPAFEDFIPGARHDHETGRTMLRDESIWISLLSMRQGEAYHNLVAAKALGLPDIPGRRDLRPVDDPGPWGQACHAEGGRQSWMARDPLLAPGLSGRHDLLGERGD